MQSELLNKIRLRRFSPPKSKPFLPPRDVQKLAKLDKLKSFLHPPQSMKMKRRSIFLKASSLEKKTNSIDFANRYDVMNGNHCTNIGLNLAKPYKQSYLFEQLKGSSMIINLDKILQPNSSTRYKKINAIRLNPIENLRNFHKRTKSYNLNADDCQSVGKSNQIMNLNLSFCFKKKSIADKEHEETPRFRSIKTDQTSAINTRKHKENENNINEKTINDEFYVTFGQSKFWDITCNLKGKS